MKKPAKIFVCLVAIIVALVAVYKTAYPVATVRYRLTLYADVDGKPVAGSSITEVSYVTSALRLYSEYGASYRGEATVLDLGNRGLLFALLKEGQDSRSGPDYIVLRAFNFSRRCPAKPCRRRHPSGQPLVRDG